MNTSFQDKTRYFVLLLLVLLNYGIFSFIFQQLAGNELGVYFLSVGQGDSQLIRSKRANILIDAGPSAKVIYELDKLIPAERRVIDLAFVSHPNYDHYGGLFEILQRYQVRLVVLDGVETTGGEYLKLQQELEKRGIPVVYARQGEEIEFGQAQLDILWPDLAYEIGAELPDSKLNDASIVALFNFQDLQVLFAGDISAKLEKQLASSLPDIDVLKVPHHGSKYSSSIEFLNVLQPELAVIETGKNSYGHPTSEAINRLQQIGAQVLRTDLDGTIGILWQRGSWRLTSGLTSEFFTP